MKANLKVIMVRAWEIKHEDSRNIFSLCLKMAWSESRNMLPTLTGSDKQVAWATEIRARELNAFNNFCTQEGDKVVKFNHMDGRQVELVYAGSTRAILELMLHHTDKASKTVELGAAVEGYLTSNPAALVELMRDYVVGQTSAAWWIDNRNVSWTTDNNCHWYRNLLTTVLAK